MGRSQSFRAAAIEAGFVEVNRSPDGTVQWLRNSTPETGEETHKSVCIDILTNSATVYWMSAPGNLNSKTFRGIGDLQEWLRLEHGTVAQQ